MTEVFSYFSQLPLLELLAVVLSIAYVVLAARVNPWCWPAAFVSTLLYVYIFYDVYLWMDSLLNVYYLFMAIYGSYCWNKARRCPIAANKLQTLVEISEWQVKQHIIAIILLSLASYAIGWVMANYTPTHFPYLDATTSVFAVFATYLITQRVLENWLYWIIIDTVSIYIYIEKGLMPTAFLFVCYTVVAVYGYLNWRLQKDAQLHQAVKLATES